VESAQIGNAANNRQNRDIACRPLTSLKRKQAAWKPDYLLHAMCGGKQSAGGIALSATISGIP